VGGKGGWWVMGFFFRACVFVLFFFLVWSFFFLFLVFYGFFLLFGFFIVLLLREMPCRVRWRRGAHGKAKTEAAARARKIKGVVNDPGLRPDLIRRHQRDRLGLEVPLAVQLASVQQHLQEAGVVSDRRDQARAPGFPAPRQCGSLIPATRERSTGNDLAMRGQLRLIRDLVSRLGHAERIEQSLLFELKQRLPRGHLDDTAEHVG